MNEHEFDQALKSAMPTPELSEGMDSRIDARLSQHRHKVALRNRLAAGGLAVVIAIAFTTLTPSRAEAELHRMAGALDNVKVLRYSHNVVLEDGSRIPYNTASYHEGKWRFDFQGRYQIYERGQMYGFEPRLNAYVKAPAPNGPFSKSTPQFTLSGLVGISKQDGMRIVIADGELRGRPMRIATLTDQFGELKVYADPKTDLPIEAHHFRAGSAKLDSTMEFDYAPKFAADAFTVQPGIRVLSQDEAFMSKVEAVTREELASYPFENKRLVIRSVDVAQDGTVFVAYQTGKKSSGSGGSRLILSDDAGTEYVAPKDPMDFGQWRSYAKKIKDGRLELEVFVPKGITPSFKPLTLKVSALIDAKGVPAQLIYGFSTFPDGTWAFRRFPDEPGYTQKQIWSRLIDQPTCEWHPRVAEWFGGEDFSTDLKSQIYRVDHLARTEMNFGRFSDAAPYLAKAIALKRQANAKGEGPFGVERDVDQLNDIKSGRMKLPPGLVIRK